MAEQVKAEIKVATPIIINLGKQKKKAIKQLKKGEGKLMAEVQEAVNHVKSQIKPDESAGTVLVPVVVLYKEKQTGALRFLNF
jgi:Family of unknown function (DUF6200)